MSSLASYTLHEYMHKGFKRQYYYVPANPERSLHALVVALHPYTGSPEWMFRTYQAIHKRGFHLLMPVGYENSWNGGACCGSAVRLGLNDVGFVQDLTMFIMEEKRLKPAHAYIVGHSNGAFLASEVALRATSHDAHWVRGVAMVVGYSYDKDLYAAALKESSSHKGFALPVLALHGTADKAVKLEGCCHEDSCCCNIYSKSCFSFKSELEQWAKINRCKTVQPSRRAFIPQNYTCMVGKGCAAPVHFCEIPGAGHDLQNVLPVGEIVADWFQADVTSVADLPDTADDESSIARGGPGFHPPPPRSAHRDATGVVVLGMFLLAIFFFLVRVFKRSNNKSGSIVAEATPRELQTLTGRPPSLIGKAGV
jgi:poly(3-hydroxybutyrate) depolymerase